MKAILFLWSTRICGQKKANNQICTGFVTKAQHSFIIMFTLSILSWWYLLQLKAWVQIHNQVPTWVLVPSPYFTFSRVWWVRRQNYRYGNMDMECKVTLSTFSAFCVSVPGTKYQLYLFVDTPTIFWTNRKRKVCQTHFK